MSARAASLARSSQAQMAVLPAAGGPNQAAGGAGPNAAAAAAPPRFLDPSLVGVGVGAGGEGDGAHAALESAALSKRRKAQRYRDLTCPRTRTSTLADGTRIVTVGSHVLVYPSAGAAAAEGVRNHPRDKAAASGAVTSFEEHPILAFSDDSFKHYSLGVGLYFKAARLLAWVFALCTVIQLPAMVLSVLANPDGGDTFEKGTVKTTVGNFGSLLTLNSTAETTWGMLPSAINRQQMALLFSCLDTAACIVLLVFCRWLHRRQQSEAAAYSRREITVRKYAVEVRNLPPFFHDRFRLAQWFEQRFGPVVDVALAFDQHDLLDVYRERGRLRKDIDLAVSHGESNKLDSLYDSLADIDTRIDAIQKDLLRRRTLGAFVVFEHQESRIACEKAFQNVWLRSLMGGNSASGSDSGGPAPSAGGGRGYVTEDPNKTLLFGQAQRVLHVRQAPEPSNIIFRNLKYTPRNKMARKFATGCATVLLLLVSVVAVYVAQRYQGETDAGGAQGCRAGITAEDVRNEGGLRDCFCAELGTTAALDSRRSSGVDCGPWLTSMAIAQGLGVLAVFVIILVNNLLKVVIKRLTLFEKHHSLTRMQESVTVKLFVGLFLNTGVVLLVVNMQLPRYAADLSGFTIAFDGLYGDFVFEWFAKVGVPIILTMLLNTVNPHVWPLLKVWWRRMRREGCCAPRRADSQSVWNDRFAGDSFELAERYAVLLNTLFVTLLYSGGMPLLLPIGAITFALTYWFDKISFLRLYRIPPRFDHSLALYLTTLMPYAVCVHAAFTLWFLSAPVLRSTALDAASTTDLASNYAAQKLADRVFGWETAPTLALLAGLALYILVMRVLRGAYRACKSAGTDPTLVAADSSRFVPYSVARRTVTLETYHPHGSPFYHDAFLRTPSRKMMKIPTPLNVLAERAKVAAKLAEEAAYAQGRAAAQQAYEQAQADRAFAQANKLIPAANASRAPLAAPPGVLQQLRGAGAPLPIDAEEGGISHAASMGIDQRRSMLLSPQQLAAQKEQAKAVARQNTTRFSSAATALSAVTAFQSAPAQLKKPSPAAHAAQSLHHKQQASQSASTTVAASGGAASDSSRGARTGASVGRDCARMGGGDAVVVLDIPEEEMAATQARVEQALRSPAEGEDGNDADACGGDDACADRDADADGDEGEGEMDGEGGSGAARPFSTYLQHHAHLSMPSNDPLLPRVQAHVHRMLNRVSQSSEDGSVAAGVVDHFPAKQTRRKGKAKRSSNQRAVADSSAAAWVGEAPTWTEGGGPSPQQQARRLQQPESMPSAVAAAAADGSGGAAASATRSSNSSDATVSESASRASDTDGAHQLVPASCPNDECGRMLELVDTGVPQMYHCPFCSAPFIM